MAASAKSSSKGSAAGATGGRDGKPDSAFRPVASATISIAPATPSSTDGIGRPPVQRIWRRAALSSQQVPATSASDMAPSASKTSGGAVKRKPPAATCQ